MAEPIYKEIGKQIINLRKYNKLTRAFLAEHLNVSHQQLYKYESGKNKIPVAVLIEIAKYFNVSLDYFIDTDLKIEEFQDMTYQEKEILDIYSNLKAGKQNLFFNIAQQFKKTTRR